MWKNVLFKKYYNLKYYSICKMLMQKQPLLNTFQHCKCKCLVKLVLLFIIILVIRLIDEYIAQYIKVN